MHSRHISLRIAQVGDAATIAHQRAAMFRDMGEVSADDFEALCKASQDWLVPLMANGDYVGWLAEESGTVVGGGGVLLREVSPSPGLFRKGLGAHVANIYTDPRYRRRGLARSVMEEILRWCDLNAIDRVTLTASLEGKPLYHSLGFEVDPMAMRIPVRPMSQSRAANPVEETGA